MSASRVFARRASSKMLLRMPWSKPNGCDEWLARNDLIGRLFAAAAFRTRFPMFQTLRS
jgi:hypothetical protein